MADGGGTDVAAAGPGAALTGAGAEATDRGARPTAPADAARMAAGGASAPGGEVPLPIACADTSSATGKRRRACKCARHRLYARAVTCNLTPTDRLCSS